MLDDFNQLEDSLTENTLFDADASQDTEDTNSDDHFDLGELPDNDVSSGEETNDSERMDRRQRRLDKYDLGSIEEEDAEQPVNAFPTSDATANAAKASDSRKQDSEKTLQTITVIFFAAGVVACLSLLFFFHNYFQWRESRDVPKVSELRQLAASTDSVLIAWTGSGPADAYRVRYTNEEGQQHFDSEIQFAVLRGLSPNSDYPVEVIPMQEGRELTAEKLTCRTNSYCAVTQVDVQEIGSDYVDIIWQYEGANQGFTAVAYALDKNGKRHLTSQQVSIAAGAETACRIEGLHPELQYTVAVMPMTEGRIIGKTNFMSGKYSNQYKLLNIIRFVICPENSQNTAQVHSLNRIYPAKAYKTSLMINGRTDSSHKVEMIMRVTDTEGNLIDSSSFPDVPTNPDDSAWFVQRSMLFDFRSPDTPGDYILYLSIDGSTVKKVRFTVIAQP